MSVLANHHFVKMNGLGNEIVVVDMRPALAAVTAQDALAVASPGGEPYDQMMTLHPPRTPGTEAYVRIYNNDGSQSGACGNGMRCVASLLFEDSTKDALQLETSAGVLTCRKAGGGLFTVDMGVPRFAWNDIPLSKKFDDTCAIALQIGPADRPILHSPSVVNVGNPHAVFWVEDVNRYKLEELGPALEHDPMFPERANISLADVKSRDHVIVRTWERGAGLTKACGSAACAAAIAAARTGRTERKVTVTLPGGDLLIEWRASDDHVLMTGPVEFEYEGQFKPALFTSSASARGAR